MTKIPYTAETFPAWALWIKSKHNDTKISISAVGQDCIYANTFCTITSGQDEEHESRVERINMNRINDYEISGTDGVWKPFYNEVEEPQWYHNIPKQGILCWVYKSNLKRRLEVVIAYEPSHMHQYVTTGGAYNYAEPAKKEEIEALIL